VSTPPDHTSEPVPVIAPDEAPVVGDDAIPESWRSLGETVPARAVSRPPQRAVPSREQSRRVREIAQRLIIAGLAVAVIAEAVAIARLLSASSSAPASVAAAPIPMTIVSGTSGDAVLIDGERVGMTPYVANINGSMHEIRVLGGVAPVTPAPMPDPPKAAAPEPLAATVSRSGGVKLVAPIDIQVLEGERVLGSSADGPIVTSAGTHQFDLVNNEFGYRERRRVDIKAGQIIPLTIAPPNGRLNINAVPWATVTIDGKEAGETPLANVSIALGSHDLVFRHPQFGERAQRVVVKADTLTRVSVTMSR